MGKCPSCSKQVDPRWNVCPWCGNDLGENPPVVRSHAEPVSFSNASNRGLLRQPWVWILVAAGAIGFTAIGLAQEDSTSGQPAGIARVLGDSSQGTDNTPNPGAIVETTTTTEAPTPTITATQPPATSTTQPPPTPTSITATTIAKPRGTADDRDADGCHDSYEGRCVPPDVSDVDCAGGSGNGPYYTRRVTVVGYDEYGLDRDKDGIGCE